MMILRHFHTARIFYSVEKSALAKLRKSTGYSFSKCKEALEKHSNDCTQAEQWLRAEAQTHGWEKATKLQGRATAQGLISVLTDSNNAVMVETNCETDFVSKNKKFHSLVHRVTQGCFNFAGEQSGGLTGNTVLCKVPLSADQLANIPLGESRPIKDETALSIGELGENIQNRRAIYFRVVAPVQLAGYTHPLPEGGVKKDVVQSGRYGAIVAYKPTSATKSSAKNAGRLEDIGRQLCQHIVGMNPTEIGTFKKVERTTEPESSTSDPDPAVVESDNVEAAEPYYNDDETALLNQEFLLDPDMKVGEYLFKNGVEVLDFSRFECGEKIETTQHG